jgi:uncharacterized protein YecT (DUF1311 family)
MKTKIFSNCVAHLIMVILCLALLPSSADSETVIPVPPKFIGTWQVTNVLIDTGATRRLHVQYNDPALKGRLLTVTSDKLVHDMGFDGSMTGLKVKSMRMGAAELIRNSMGWRGFDPQIPTPADYGLPLKANAPVEVFRFVGKEGLWCGGLGRDGGIMGAWFIVLSDGRLAMRWYDESILILKRLPANTKPIASFNCVKAKTSVEKTICGSVELASFDLSIMESYANALLFYKDGDDPEGLRRLKAAQREWLKKRNACGTDAACLRESMRDQLNVLSEPWKFSPDE